jgi:hypothetical protein
VVGGLVGAPTLQPNPHLHVNVPFKPILIRTSCEVINREY